MLSQASNQAALQFRISRIGDAREMITRLDEVARRNFHTGEVQLHTLALGIGGGNHQGIRPGHQCIVGAQRVNAVVAFRKVGGEDKVGGGKLHGLLIQAQSLVEHLWLRELVKLPRIFAV